MSKAYDTVHIPLLVKTLQRIHILTKIINLLSHLLNSRKNTVITDIGITKPYTVQDGIDQGETFSPILWRIYYDPLISRIDTTYQGYLLDTNTPARTISTHASVVAYMDNTV